MDNRLSKLAELMKLQVSSAQTRLLQVQKKEKDLLDLLNELSAESTHLGQCGGTESIADYQNNLQMRKWIERRRTLVNAELARTRVFLKIARAELERYLARHQATEDLANLNRKVELHKVYRAY